MPKLIKLATALCLLGAVLFGALYGLFPLEPLMSLAITFGTVSYHLLARLAAGGILGSPAVIRPRWDRGWFRVREWEHGLYRALRVKAWKDKMPTYAPGAFSPKLQSLEELAGNMCRSELVHEANAVLSLLPLFAPVWFGAFWVFLTTSLLGAAFDLSFAVIQRYNRGRIAKIARRQEGRGVSGGGG